MESISEMIPFRVWREQDKIGKIWTGNIIPTWERHTQSEEVSLVGLDNRTATQSITRKLEVKV